MRRQRHAYGSLRFGGPTDDATAAELGEEWLCAVDHAERR